jgi:hypothetical protein
MSSVMQLDNFVCLQNSRDWMESTELADLLPATLFAYLGW